MHACSPSTWEAGAGRSLCIWGQPDLLREFQASEDYTLRPCLKNKTRTGVGEMAWWLRALAALSEDWSWVPGTQVWPVTPAPGGPTPLASVCIHTNTRTDK